jgi:bifunctional enzyme CysN/CysC
LTPSTATRTANASGLRTTQPLFYDEYRRNRETGSFILVDEATNATVGAGMITGPAQ